MTTGPYYQGLPWPRWGHLEVSTHRLIARKYKWTARGIGLLVDDFVPMSKSTEVVTTVPGECLIVIRLAWYARLTLGVAGWLARRRARLAFDTMIPVGLTYTIEVRYGQA